MKQFSRYSLIVLFCCNLNAADNQPIPIGNFALPVALMPSPLFSFGQNTVNKNDMLGYINPIYLRGKRGKKNFYNLIYALYGISDNLSIFALIDVPAIFKDNKLTSSGFGDTIIQGEYAYINTSTATTQTQATIVGSIYLPSGVFEASKQGPNLPPHAPFTGFGSTSFFLGGTISYTTIDWYFFSSVGNFFMTQHDNTKLGNILLYQGGIGVNLHHFNDRILMLMAEMDGIYTKRDKLLGTIDLNSGFNTIFLGPVLYYATKRLIFQTGIQVPVFQKFNGIQAKNSYLFSVSLAWLFNHDEYK